MADTAEFVRLTGLHARACAVVALGAGVDAVESVAVWHVSSDGAPTGAWVRPQTEVLADGDGARRLLTLLEGRAITGTSLEAVDDWLERLSAVAGSGDRGRWWKACTFSPVEVFHETVARRRAYEATVSAERERNKSLAAVSWPHELSDHTVVMDVADLRKLAGIATPDGTPVVSEALAVSRLLNWLVAAWAEVEDVKARRTYVRVEHGAAEPLPPAWLTAVRTAADIRQSS